MRTDSRSKPENAEEAEVRGSGRRQRYLENEFTEKIIAAAIEVHRNLGPGLLESAYEECLCYELSQRGLRFKRQVNLPITYKGLKLDCGHKMDLVVEDAVIVELKTVDRLLPIHSAQLLTYLKSSGKQIGLLINFNVPVLKDGLKRMVNRYAGPAPVARVSASSAAELEQQHSAETTSGLNSSFSLRESPRLRVSAVSKEPA